MTLLGVAAISVVGLLVLLRHRFAVLRTARVIAAVLALIAAAVAAQRWLLVSNVELIHLPQFGLFAALLLAMGLGPHAAFLGATIAGVLDETYQHLVIYAHTPGTYFDYNDIVLNAIGAAWVVVLAGAGERHYGRIRQVIIVAVVVITIAVLWIVPPHGVGTDSFPYWRPALSRALTGFDYHVMNASEGVLALALLWAVVALATRPDPAAGGALVTARAAAVWMLAIGACTSHAPRPVIAAAWGSGSAPLPPVPLNGTTAPSDWPFIVTFWCGPPLAQFTDAQAAAIAAAGFTVVGAPCEGMINPELNRRALDIAARHGLTMWILDHRTSQYDELAPDWAARLQAAVTEYGDHPALGGYFLVDEPSAEKFPALGLVVDWLRAVDPKRVPYINLLPAYVPLEALGTGTYREHIERYMAEVRPPLLSYDYYPFKVDSDRDTFFESLVLIRDVAQRYGVPFLLIVQAMPHGNYRDPTEGELAWQINHALAFGARGISYFAYWTPVHVPGADRWQFRHGLVEDARPTEHFAEAARLNREARAHAAQLIGMRSAAIADSEGVFAPPLPFGPIGDISGAPVTAGFFTGHGMTAVLLVNQDYRQPRDLELHVRSSATPEVFDTVAERWRRLRDDRIPLAAGGAALLRWRNAA